MKSGKTSSIVYDWVFWSEQTNKLNSEKKIVLLADFIYKLVWRRLIITSHFPTLYSRLNILPISLHASILHNSILHTYIHLRKYAFKCYAHIYLLTTTDKTCIMQYTYNPYNWQDIQNKFTLATMPLMRNLLIYKYFTILIQLKLNKYIH